MVGFARLLTILSVMESVVSDVTWKAMNGEKCRKHRREQFIAEPDFSQQIEAPRTNVK